MQTQRDPDVEGPTLAEGLFRHAFERARIGMAISDPDGWLQMVNAAYADLVGRTRDVLLTTTWMALTHPADREVEHAFERQALAKGGGTFSGEKRYIRPDGSTVWALVNRSLLVDPVDGSRYFLSQVLDIGERKRTAELLQHQNEELAALHQTTLGLISRLEPTSLLEAILTQAAALVDTPHAYLYVVDQPQDRLMVRAGIGVFGDYVGFSVGRGEGLAGKVWESGEAMAVGDYAGWGGKITGFDFVRAAVAIPLRAGEELMGVIGLVRLDEGRPFQEQEIELLTRFGHFASLALENARLYEAAQEELAERRRTEKELERTATELREANEELRKADELKSHFVAVASHELRTPLTSVLGYASTLLRFWHRLTDEQRRSQVAIIEEQGERLGRLVDDLLIMSRIDAGVLETRPEDVELPQAVGRVVDSFPDHATEIMLRVPDDLQVHADPDHLAQILLNYVSNALKYGGSLVEVEAVAADGWVEIRVRDQGQGVPPEFEGRLFEKFAQAPSSHGSGGTGLGLSIVRGLARAHGGEAWYERNESHGSCFAVRLPAPAGAEGPS